jgi:hypothetical protein
MFHLESFEGGPGSSFCALEFELRFSPSSGCSHDWSKREFKTIVHMSVSCSWADIARTTLCFRGPFRVWLVTGLRSYQTIVQMYILSSWAYLARISYSFEWFWVEISTLRGVITNGPNGSSKPLYICWFDVLELISLERASVFEVHLGVWLVTGLKSYQTIVQVAVIASYVVLSRCVTPLWRKLAWFVLTWALDVNVHSISVSWLC